MTQALKFLQRGTQSTQYVDDLFNIQLRTGTGASATVTNNLPMSTTGGLSITKSRSAATGWRYTDTARGATSSLDSSSTAAAVTESQGLTAFNSDGYTIGTDADYNTSGAIYVDYNFVKAAKFFDVVTFTSSSSGDKTFNHNLGQAPGMVIIKNTQTTDPWIIYHVSNGNDYYMDFSTSAKQPLTGAFSVTSTSVTISSSLMYNSQSYVAYLFAHDTATDGIIQCGSFTTDGSGNATVTLGWEPQFLTYKISSDVGDWRMVDVMRGWTNGSNDALLRANLSNAEGSTTGQGEPTATGFSFTGGVLGASQTYIYLAIRRPNKPPTTGTQVFQPTVYTGTNADNRHLDTTIAPDMVWLRQRSDTTFGGMLVGSRLTGQAYLATGTTAAEVTAADALDQQLVSATEYGTAFSSMSGIYIGNNATADINLGTTASDHIALAFKRYPGVFDVVCYTGTGVTRTVEHNLGVVPEMMFVKVRTTAGYAWRVYHSGIGNTKALSLNVSDAEVVDTYWNNTTPTSSVFTVSDYGQVNNSGSGIIAFLFATKAGISKVFSYTGNGTNQTIDCGFSAGARFVLIKRTDSTGSWFVFDTARGIVAGNDPFLRLESTAAEITSVDALDTDNSGFIVNQDATYNLNVNTATYIGLAIA